MDQSNNPAFLGELQIAWDSVSTGAAKQCWRLWELSILRGWRPKAQQVDLEFGLYYHAGCERYDRERVKGRGHEEALLEAVRFTLELTWDRGRNRPWITDDSNKNRLTLLRSIVWYLDEFMEEKVSTLVFSDGTPAVELGFRYETGFKLAGAHFILCGHVDKIAGVGEDPYIFDKKTTKHTLTPSYYKQFTPNSQFSGYAMAGRVVFGLPVKGVVVDAAQVAVGFTRFERKFIERTDSQLEEWLRGMEVLWSQAEENARNQFWPMNETACWMCRFRGICSLRPEARETWLKADFTQVQWRPLDVRTGEGGV